MHVHINWEIHYRPTGWSLGYCTSCQQESVVCIEDAVEVMYLYGIIPLSKIMKGQVARCDFCRRTVEVVHDCNEASLEEWSPQDGISALRKQLRLPAPSTIPNPSSDERLHSLLTSLRDAASVTRYKLKPYGILFGAIFGAVTGILLAHWLHENKIAGPQPDVTGWVIVLALPGMALGALLGATVEFLLRRDRNASARIQEAYEKYPFDLGQLENLSQSYSRCVQRAVKRICEQMPRGL